MTTEGAPHRRLSLRVLLLLIFAAALSPVLVIGGIRWSGDVEREAQYRRETMGLVAQVAASNAESALNSAPAILNLLTSAGSGNVTTEMACNLPLDALIDALPDFASIGVVDANGRIVCTSHEGAVGADVSDRAWFIELSSSGANFIQSGALVSSITNEWMIASAKPLLDERGTFAGGIVLGSTINRLVAQLATRAMPASAEVALVDSTGRVFDSKFWDTLDSTTMTSLSPDGLSHMQLRGPDSQMRDVAIMRLGNNELYVLVSAPPPPAIGLENVSAFGNFALPLLAWLLALVTAWLAMDRLVLRWLDYLRRIATLYASGKLTVQPIRAKRQAPIEINSLADTMEEMAVRIRDRTVRMENALEARDAAMKEIHHRVKNNLQIINSLLSLQGRKLKDPAAKEVLDDARARINALSLIHRSLYEHNNISAVETRSFLTELASHLDQALGAEERGVRIESSVDEDRIEADLAVPLALFTAEAVTNSVKHAFPTARPGGGGVRIVVSYRAHAAETLLSVEDDGVGYEEVAAASAAGIGNTLMSAFAKQVGGVLEEGPIAGGIGRYIRIRIPRAIGVDRQPAQVITPATGS